MVWFTPLIFYFIPRPESHEKVQGYSEVTPFFPGVIFYILIGLLAIIFGLFFSIPAKNLNNNSLVNKEEDTKKSLDYAFKKSLLLFILATIGVLASWFKIISNNGFGSIITSIALGTANDFREILYDGYVAFPYGLRHLVGPCAGVLLFTIFELKKHRYLSIPILVVLLLNVMITSRLSLILFTIVYITCFLRTGKKVSKTSILVGFTLIILVLMVTNYIRNVNYFNSFGVYNPITMLLLQIRQYLETAFVGALSFLNSPMTFPSGDYIEISNSGGEFLSSKAVHYTGIKEEFTQISGLLFLYSKIGVSTIFIFPLVIGLAIGTLNFYNKLGLKYFLEVGTITYGIIDSWRTFIFFQGFFVINILFFLLLSIFLHKKRNHIFGEK